MTSETLADYGWTPFFAAAGDPSLLAARVMAVHRGRLRLAGPGLEIDVAPFTEARGDPEASATVGDWLLLDPDGHRPKRLLPRRSLFRRRAPGTGRGVQLIAANVDTLLVLSSCNEDFSLARLERYLALARDAEVMPVVVLTKPDLAESPQDFVRAAARLLPGLLVVAVDARRPDCAACLAPWCARGQTVALVGSSGVGKSTLVNTLAGGAIATQPTRAHDGTGRHTTSGRALHRLPAGGWLLDTPGMRELQFFDVTDGLDEVFADIILLAGSCRFADCSHGGEPGCAVAAAIEAGTLDAARLARWKKLAVEDAFNSATLAERRAKDRAFGKMARRVMREKQERRR